MDFLRNHAHLTGGDTRKAPKNTQFSKSRHTPRGQGSPPRQPLSITARVPPTPTPLNHGISRQTLSILSNTNTHSPTNQRN